MSSICPKCGKFMEGDICEKCQAAEAAEKYNEKMAKKKRIQKEEAETKPVLTESEEATQSETGETSEQTSEVPKKKKTLIHVFIGTFVTFVVIPLVIILIINMMATSEAKKEFISDAEEDFAEIKDDYNNKRYYSLMSKLEKYENRYSEESQYYKALPGNLRGEYISDLYTTTIGDSLMGEILKWEEKIKKSTGKSYGDGPVSNELERMGASITDYSYYKSLTNALHEFETCFPDGYTYTDESGNTKTFGKPSEINNMYKNYKYREILIRYTKGEKTEALQDMNFYISMGYAPSNRSDVGTIFYIMKINHPAKDFKITGGSSNVYPFKSGRNYSWQCPYCGYFSEGVGQPYDINPREHYPGEVYTYNGGMVCASAFQGGCKRMSSYQLEITFE